MISPRLFRRPSGQAHVLSVVANLLLVAVLFLGVVWVAQSYLPAPIAKRLFTRAPKPLSLTAVERALDLLDQSYIYPVEERKLFESALKGLKETLKADKLPVSDVCDLRPESKERKDFLADLRADLEAAHKVAGDKISEQKLLYGALRGLVGGLDDPYCVVFDPEEFKHFDEQMSGGNFGGIGVYMEADRANHNRLTVVEPIEDTPAWQAHLREGDVIEKINGQSTKGWEIEKAVGLIRGEAGTSVQLSIFRPSDNSRFDVDVKRAKIHTRSVSSRLLKDIGYIRIRIYGEDTDKEFDQELKKMVSKGAKALVIDLRNNGGGYVNAAIEVCSHFVGKGETVVSVVNARVGRHDSFPSSGPQAGEVNLPMVVLVNRYSASASEITAGCLKDHKIAKLVGEKTFGKASVQALEKLSDGGALKYTIAHYLTPNGRDIHKRGISVDTEVKVHSSDTTDKALEAAQAELHRQLSGATSK